MATAEDPFIGRVIDNRYRIDARIGRGGFGAVYKATHLGLGRPVAFKRIRSDGNEDLTARFRREARLQAMLRHPVCVIVHDYGEDDGDPWLVQELIEGRELHTVLREEGQLDPARAILLTCRLLEGIAAAHAHGIIHRDIKPSNIMLVRESDREDVRLLDFGIARAMAEEDTCLTSPGTVVGTPRYISPEQARGKPPEPANDLYAVGVVLYHMLAGHPPFPALDMREAVIQHLTVEVPPLPPEIPPRIAAVVYAALAKHPEARPPTAPAMIDRLRAALRVTTSTAAPAAPLLSSDAIPSDALQRDALPSPAMPQPPPPPESHASTPQPASPRRTLPLLALTLLIGMGALAGARALFGNSDPHPPTRHTSPAATPEPTPPAPPPTLPPAPQPIPSYPPTEAAPLIFDALPEDTLDLGPPDPSDPPDSSDAHLPSPDATAPAAPTAPPTRSPTRRHRLARQFQAALDRCDCDEAERMLESLAVISPLDQDRHRRAFVNRCRLFTSSGCRPMP